MATRNETHVHDLSTLANFKDWAQSISTALTAFGWTQSTDTGQVNWASIASVPTSGNYVYEIWQPGDGGTAFYIRIDYGNNGGNPGLRIQGGTTTNGTGTLTGFTTTQSIVQTSGNTGSTLLNCLYCGDSSSFAIMLWRDAGAAFNFLIAVDRSRNSSGATTNSYFTVFSTKNSNATFSPWWHQSVMFGVGAAPACGVGNSSNNWNCIYAGAIIGNTNQSLSFNGNVGFKPAFPNIGYDDVPTLVVGHVGQTDFSELALITTTMLGSSHTYIFSKNQVFNANFNLGVVMRWE